ncbi:hypothetical protein ACIO3R_01900 [Streptomyces sp. NPDC087428]|uniref:hypothetical protein n=1 Tax=Streptomyces sp. NPDC087428 TaxID=3365788 RepID=UPI00381F7793
MVRDTDGACDRRHAHAEGARPGAPDALRAADRFQLWQGLGSSLLGPGEYGQRSPTVR